MSSDVTKNAQWGLLAVVLFFLLAVGLSVYTAFRFNQAATWTVHTHQVIEEILGAVSSLQDVEIGQRGFLLTHSEDFLKPYLMGKANLVQHLAKLENETSDNPVQQSNARLLKSLAMQRTEVASKVVETAKEMPLEAIERVRMGRGKMLMDKFRAQSDKMIEKETRLLARRNAQLQQSQTIAYVSIGTLILACFGILNWVSTTVQAFVRSEQARIAELAVEVDSRRKSEEMLRGLTLKLAASNEDLQQFAYVASHDLQEPLRAVIGFLTLLDKRLGEELASDTREWLHHAVEGGQRMRTLVNDLLSYSRVESQDTPFETDIDLNIVVQEALKNLSIAVEESGARFDVAHLPRVKGDRLQLIQIFQNLIGNAIKYRSANRNLTIEIAARVERTRCVISVKDNGIGFDVTHAKRIFIIFQRLHTRG